jgi:phytoene dehydrogenase-like protein
MAKSIIIIGAGMGGLSAGIYGQINGYKTQIFEMHIKPGGQCTAWKRKGYTFDVCIHHFFGCRPGNNINDLWKELGVLPRPLVKTTECTAVLSPEGKLFVDYYDLEKLRETLLKLSPNDKKMINRYIELIKVFSEKNLMDVMNGGSRLKMLRMLPTMLRVQKWLKMEMKTFAEQFTDPFLKQAFAELVYSNPESPLFFHLIRHSGGIKGDIQWPVGGASELARSIEQRYLTLGGTIHYKSQVEKIIVEHDKAVGIRLTDGTEHRADIIISDADGRKTINDMLDGKYTNDIVQGYSAPNQDETPFGVDVFLGVNRDLSKEPSSLAFPFKHPMQIGNHTVHGMEAQLYGFDSTMAPEGKGTIKVELNASYAYWKELYNTDKERYQQEKQKIAEQVIKILEQRYPGLQKQVEVIDVCTLMTWERYIGGTQGWFNFPKRKMQFNLKPETEDKTYKTTLPGLSNFYFVGVWATMMGSLPHNALSGKTIIQRLCKQDGKTFQTQS